MPRSCTAAILAALPPYRSHLGCPTLPYRSHPDCPVPRTAAILAALFPYRSHLGGPLSYRCHLGGHVADSPKKQLIS